MLFKNDQFTNTGSGQIQEKLRKEAFFSAGALSLDDGETFRGGLEVFTDPHE